jgi:hypothetical protein
MSEHADSQISSWYQSHKYFRIGGKCLFEWFTLEESAVEEQHVDDKSRKTKLDYIQWFKQAFTLMITGRKLFSTREGYIGLGRESVTDGDVVCILPGCSVPIILRKENWYYKLVGDSYIHGIMFGEALGQMTEDKRLLKLQSFVLK